VLLWKPQSQDLRDNYLKYVRNLTSVITRGLRQRETELKGATGQQPEQSWEMIVNPDVNGYAKTRNHRKTLQKNFIKTQKNSNPLETKTIPNYTLNGGPVVTFALPEGAVRTPTILSATPLNLIHIPM